MELAVLGATGRTGGATVRALLERGASVRAITRDVSSERAVALARAGATVVAADMSDSAALAEAIRGSSGMFSVQPAFDARGRHDADAERAQATSVAAAASEAGVARVVLLGAGPGHETGIPHFDTKLHARGELERLGVAVTVLSPAPFMELLTDRSFAPALSTWGVQPRVVGWERPLPWVCAEDIGVVAASCLLDPPEPGTSIFLAADRVSLGACRALLRARGLRARGVPLPEWLGRRMMGHELPDMWRWLRGPDAEAFPVDASAFVERCPSPRRIAGWLDEIVLGRGAAASEAQA